MNISNQLETETKCVHSGIEENEFGSVVALIYRTSTLSFEIVKHEADLFNME